MPLWFNSVKITDFGLARRLEGDSGLTQTGAIVGTPSYMAPEQAQARKDVGPAADVWALGAILYECLTGRPSFRGATTLDTLQQVLMDDPVAPRRLQPNLPADLDTIALKCLQKDPARRYASAAALADDLQRFVERRPILARPTPAWERGWLWARRHPAVASLTASLVVGGLVALAVVTSLWRQAEQSARDAITSAEKEGEAKLAAQDAERDAVTARDRDERTLYLRNLEVARQRWRAGATWDGEAYLNACPPRQRGPEWHLLKNWFRQPDRAVIRRTLQSSQSVAFHPDGRTLACAQPRRVELLDPVTGALKATIAMPGEDGGRVRYSPDGGELAWVSHRGYAREKMAEQLTLMDAATGRVRIRVPARDCVAFSPDGRHVASAAKREGWTLLPGTSAYDVLLIERHSGRSSRLRGAKAQIDSVAFSPRGDHLAAGGAHGNVWVWTLRPGGYPALAAAVAGGGPWAALGWALAAPAPRLRFDWSCGNSQVASLAFSPDGVRLATANGDQYLRVWNLDRELEERPAQLHPSPLSDLCWRPGSAEVVTIAHDGAVRSWDTANGRLAAVFAGHAHTGFAVAASPDGQTLVSSAQDGTVRRWSPGSPPGPATWRGHDGPVNAIAVSEAGLVASVSNDGTARLWDPATGRPRLLYTHNTQLTRAVFGPGGTWLACADMAGLVVLIDVATGRVLRKLEGPLDVVIGLAVQPQGKLLATSGMLGSVKLWDPATGAEVRSMNSLVEGKRGAIERAALALAFSPDGRHLFGLHTLGRVTRFDVETGQPDAPIGNDGTGGYLALDASPDGRWLVAGGSSNMRDGELRLFDLAAGRVIRKLTGSGGVVRAARFTPDGRYVVSAGTDGTVRLWSVAEGREVLTLQDHERAANCLAFRDGGRQMLTGGGDGLIRAHDLTPCPERTIKRFRWAVQAAAVNGDEVAVALRSAEVAILHAATGQQLRDWRESELVSTACYLPRSGRLVTAGIRGTLKVWPREAGGEPLVIRGPKDYANRIAAHPTRDEFASVWNDGVVRVWDGEGKPLRELRGHKGKLKAAAYLAGGQLLASGGEDRAVRLWDADTGEAVASLDQPAGVVALAGDGRSLAVATADGKLTLWDADARRPGRTLRAAGDRPLGAVAMRGGLVAGGRDNGEVLVWDARDGRLLATYAGHTGKVTALEFLADGQALMSTSEDGSVRVWDLPAR